MKTKDTNISKISELSRRDFLWSSAIGLGGLLMLDTLSACRPSEPGEDSYVPFSEEDDTHFGLPAEFSEITVPTTCWIGKQDCGLLARVLTQTIDGKSINRIIKLEGNPRHPRNLGKLCPKGAAQLQAVYDYNRVKWPLRRINAKGQPGQFIRISWSDAYNEVQAQLEDAKVNAKAILWQKGRSKAKSFYDNGFEKALASWASPDTVVSKVGHGSYCSDAGYRAAEYTLGLHGVISPDFAHTQYLLSWGWGLTTSGGNKFCWLTWPQKFTAARHRSENPLKKVVVLDPNRRQTGPHSDEWLPNRPGSDLAFFLGIAHYLVTGDAAGFDSGLIDQDYLKNHSNAPFLIRSEGRILVDETSGLEQVWDPSINDGEGGPVDYDTAQDSQLLFETVHYVDGEEVVPAYQVYVNHLQGFNWNGTLTREGFEINDPSNPPRPYTTDWADAVCDLPSGSVARIARELFENAQIGSTIELEGVTLPYRPVSMMAYHVAQQELGFPSVRAGINVFQLLGAIDVPGGIQVDFGPSSLYKNWTKLNEISIKTDNLNYDLAKSKFFPIASKCPSFFHRAQLDPERYDVDESTIPKKVIVHMVDPARSFTDSPTIRQAYSQFEHVTVLTPWMSETASLFANLILPTATIEKYEGPMSGSTPDEKADALRLPPVSPLWESKGEIDIYLDIAQRVGFLDTYLEKINSALGLEEPYLIDPAGGKPTPREIFDTWAQYKGKSGIEYFEEYGVTDIAVRTPETKYTSAMSPAYHGARHRLYGEMLAAYGRDMIDAGIEASVVPHVQDYTAFPTWREPTMWRSEESHPLHLLSHKQVEFKQSRASFVPYLAELSPRQGLLINPYTAAELGIYDGDDVVVESHNAMTGETRRVRTQAVLHSTIRPDTVSMSHHYGLSVSPTNEGQGPSPNELFFSGEGYIQCTQDASFHVMVRVTKA